MKDKIETSVIDFFSFEHLPLNLQDTSQKYYELASWIDENLPGCAEKTVALRKLLESKDAAVRTSLSATIKGYKKGYDEKG